MRTRVKICGITNIGDARHAVECGADALGFVFFPDSPRSVDIDVSGEIIRKVPPFISSVGVFVNATVDQIADVVDNAGLQAVQLHGDEGPDFIAMLHGRMPHTRIIKALKETQTADFVSFGACSLDAVLLDTFHEALPGGTGKTYDWDIALKAQIAGGTPFILAGGLKPENITAALTKVNPFGVDVSSGVELVPGKKDPDKVKTFIDRIKEYDTITR